MALEDVIEAAVRRAVREEFAKLAAPRAEGGRLRIGKYAEHAALSIPTVRALIREGLPVVGAGRLQRIDVAAADQWLAQHGTDKTDISDQARKIRTGSVR